ncbi:hypothetical protein [Tenacibaculum agarivorans]|uniref:hypothetical protein n=1 Tax=Tenacibaculum agarivorans TaxID=1908389 RepID=UPI00118165A9|nr:hypothetical protein [Tenacibaculum agarivorans]
MQIPTLENPNGRFKKSHLGKNNVLHSQALDEKQRSEKILLNTQKSFHSYEQDRLRAEKEAKERELVRRRIQREYGTKLHLEIPSRATEEERQYYRKAFEKLLQMHTDSFSVKKATFIVENAFYDEKQDFKKFDKIIKRTGSFLKEKMKEKNYDPHSNLTKNLILFQFFADTLEIKSKGLKHLPLKYDFDDYIGKKDWGKMFVSKLLATGKGQCHSLPLLYLMLADEIGAKASLSLSPNHSYIKFQDEKKKWYNVELTNGMFTTDTYILQSGYITSEALQNGIYMQELTKKQLLSQTLNDLALGYTRKFGYDSFLKKIIDKSLELDSKSIHTNILLENYLTVQFEYITRNCLGINPRNHQELQQIGRFPELVDLLKKINEVQQKVDDLGYKTMPDEIYQKWLGSLQQKKQQQDDKELKEKFRINLKTMKN